MQILPTIQEEMIEWCSEKWLFNQLSSEQTIYCQILYTVWYLSGERLKEKIEVDERVTPDLPHATSFTTRQSCRMLKHVLKPYDNRGLKIVASRKEVVCNKIVPCKSAFRYI